MVVIRVNVNVFLTVDDGMVVMGIYRCLFGRQVRTEMSGVYSAAVEKWYLYSEMSLSYIHVVLASWALDNTLEATN